MTERLRELLAAATPGPWFRQGTLVHGEDRGGIDIGPVLGWHDLAEMDAALIVEAVNALPDLLDAHDRMAGALRGLLDATVLYETAGSQTAILAAIEQIGASQEEARAALALAVPREPA